jgi:hypothetical protein
VTASPTRCKRRRRMQSRLVEGGRAAFFVSQKGYQSERDFLYRVPSCGDSAYLNQMILPGFVYSDSPRTRSRRLRQNAQSRQSLIEGDPDVGAYGSGRYSIHKLVKVYNAFSNRPSPIPSCMQKCGKYGMVGRIYKMWLCSIATVRCLYYPSWFCVPRIRRGPEKGFPGCPGAAMQ